MDHIFLPPHILAFEMVPGWMGQEYRMARIWDGKNMEVPAWPPCKLMVKTRGPPITAVE